VHFALHSRSAHPLPSDKLEDFTELDAVTDLSLRPYSEYAEILESLIREKKISTVLQVGAAGLYPLLPHLKIKFPTIRIVDLLFNPYGHNWDHFLFENAIDTVIVESQFMANFIRRSTLIQDRDIRVVLSGIEFPSELVFSAPRESDQIVVGYAGRLSEEKGPLEFVKIVEEFAPTTAASFKMFGSGPMEQEVKNAVERSNLSERLSIEGFLPKAVDALSQLDILVLPSRFDGRPVAIMEAGALGVVTVAAGVGGIPEMIRDGVNGFCIAPWSVAEAVERISSLINDRAMLASMKATSREFARKEFSIDQMLIGYATALGAQ
jgi:glycosyltransferase involved in cell wall biosynthesis